MTTEYTGKQKLAFAKQMINDWQDLADYCEIPPADRKSFERGREPQEVWEWLESHGKMNILVAALKFIGREDIVTTILEPPPTPEKAGQPIWSGSPFPGLRYFKAHEAPIFFGRERETRELAEIVVNTPLVAVIGASGSGKSSLVAAGLIPYLAEQKETANWQCVRFTPGGPSDDPFANLAGALENELKDFHENSRDIADQLRARGAISEVAEKYLTHQSDDTKLLLFIDQFEELFTLTQPKLQPKFIKMLENATSDPRLRWTLTLRADFYHHCIEHPTLANLFRGNAGYPLAAPELPALWQMITGPAAIADLSFEDELPARILTDTGNDPGALALMAFALAELYKLREKDQLTHSGYDSFGGVSGAIAQRAEHAYNSLDESAQKALAEVFTALVEVDPEQGVATRKRAPLNQFKDSSTAQKFIDVFTRERLLVSDGDGDKALLEVAHEALLRNWPRLADWIEERFDDFRLLRQVKLEAEDWQHRGQNEAHLWRHERLLPVYEVCERLKPKLSDIEQAFIQPEAERLLEEIEQPQTTHQRRAIIGDRLAEIGDPRPGVGLTNDGLPDLVWLPVPAGEIQIEMDEGDAVKFQVEPFYISKYLLTWMQYRCFLQAEDGYHNTQWWQGLEHEEEPGKQYRQLDNHPAENLSWYDAIAYCRWLSKQLGYEVKLPTEHQWQQAATAGNTNFEYPWGEKWRDDCANTFECGLSRSIAVGLYPQGISPIGAFDMSGNVDEWCLNEYENPGKTDETDDDARRVVRGGSWDSYSAGSRASFRNFDWPGARLVSLGVRLVCSSPMNR